MSKKWQKMAKNEQKMSKKRQFIKKCILNTNKLILILFDVSE